MKRVEYPSGDSQLVGILEDDGFEDCVILCHGLMADKNSNTLFSSLATSLRNKNIASFRFDFTGCGETRSAPLSLSKMREDLGKTLQIIDDIDYKRVFVLGHSLGGQIALEAHEKPKILLSPYLEEDKSTIAKFRKKLNGQSQGKIPNKFGVEHIITEKFLDEMSAITLKESLRKINNETLMIIAENDKIIPSKKYKHKTILKNSKITIKSIETNHNYTTNRKKLFRSISLMIKENKHNMSS